MSVCNQESRAPVKTKKGKEWKYLQVLANWGHAESTKRIMLPLNKMKNGLNY